MMKTEVFIGQGGRLAEWFSAFGNSGVFLTYTFKTALFLVLFYLFFRLAFGKETFHRFNRIVLLASVLFSFLLPLCVWTYRVVLPAPEWMGYNGLSVMADSPEPVGEKASWHEWLLPAVYFIGVGVWLGRLLFCTGRLLRLIRRSKKSVLPDGITLVESEKIRTVFSWFNYIVIPTGLSEGKEVILAHERVHIQLGHSYDLLGLNIVGCLQWFNPAIWLIRQDLQAIHEYEADEAVLSAGTDAREYQLLLIKKAAGGKWSAVANSFNRHHLKKRITMMLKEKSNRVARTRVFWALPLLLGGVLLFAQKEYVFASAEVGLDGIRVENADIRITKDTLTASKTSTTTYVANGKVSASVQSSGDSERVTITVNGKEVTKEELKTLLKEGLQNQLQLDAFDINLTKSKDGVKTVTFTLKDDSADKAKTENSNVSVKILASESDTSVSISVGSSVASTASASKAKDGSAGKNMSSVIITKGEKDKTIVIQSDGKDFNEGDFSDVEIWIDGKKSTREGLDKLSSEKIVTVQVDKTGDGSGKISITTSGKQKQNAKKSRR